MAPLSLLYRTYFRIGCGAILVGILALLLAPSAHAQVPANDACANPVPLVVHNIFDCPFLGIPGTTVGATQDGPAPLCDPDGVFLDVWYTVNSGPDTLLNFYLLPSPQMTDYGLTFYTTCGGAEVDCGYAPQQSYDIEVMPNTTYLVRVSTNTDFGNPGTFTLCASSYPPIPTCDGSVVKTTLGEVVVNVCDDGIADLVALQNFSLASAPYVYVLSTATDTIIRVLDANFLDADTLPLGNYRLWGISYVGSLTNATPGGPISGVGSTGTCSDLSDNYVELSVDICSGITTAEGNALVVFLDPITQVIRIRPDQDLGPVEVSLFDASGRSVRTWRSVLDGGAAAELSIGHSLSPGIYHVAVVGAHQVHTHTVFVP